MAQALAALDWLRAAGARHVYWKYCSTFDSTPRGNIGPVTQALLARLRARQTLYVPIPGKRAAGVHGQHVRGRPAAGRKPDEGPPAEPDDRQRPDARAGGATGEDADKVGLIDWPTIRRGPEAIAEATGRCPTHMICDAIEDADLCCAGAVAHHLPLLTGSSALPGICPAWRAAGLLGPAAAPTPCPRCRKARRWCCRAVVRR